MLNSKTIFLYLQNIKKTIDNNKDEIEKLDQEIGDGDHIFNIQRGIKESLNLQDELSSHTPDEVFKKIPTLNEKRNIESFYKKIKKEKIK